MKYGYNEIINMLRNGVISVTFEKVDGTDRTMNCTLLPRYLPEEFKDKKPMLTETVPTNVSVWDIDSSGWRSFRLSSIKEIISSGC